MWRYLTGSIDLLIQYADGNPIWINCPSEEAWTDFRNIATLVCNLTQSEEQRRHCFHGSSIRGMSKWILLATQLGRISTRFTPGDFAWVSADVALGIVGRLSFGDIEYFSVSIREVNHLARLFPADANRIGDCELIAAIIAITRWSTGGLRNIILCTDDRNVLSWARNARSNPRSSNRVFRVLNSFCIK